MKPDDRTPASQHLDRKAEHLAQRHQRRLNEMTDAALASAPRRRVHWLAPQPAVAFISLSVAVLAWWVIPSPENESSLSAPQVAAIPNWVLDDEVPLELLESPEFYRWLADQIATDAHTKTLQQG